MRFTTVGHACLHVVAEDGTTLLVDPWLIGTCYWRSWFHYPPIETIEDEWLAPDYCYLTHYHFDHFHYPSMRKLDRNTQMLIPRFGIDTMYHELRGLGFKRIEELPHGKIQDITPALRVASYQYGFDDTTFVMADQDTVLVDMNDCKIRGWPLAQIARDFGNPTFLFRGHSYAMSYPLCYASDDPADLSLVTRESFYDEFLEIVRALRPRYAVPYGSTTAFLHPENIEFNPDCVMPDEVVAVSLDAPDLGDTEVIAMGGGDRWSPAAGFDLRPDDWLGERPRRLVEMAAEHAATFERARVEEAALEVRFEEFEAYLQAFMRALPPLAARVLLRRKLVFEIRGAEGPYWVVDFGGRRVSRETELPDDYASRTWIPEGPLGDAIRKRIMSFCTGMLRMRVQLQPGGIHTDLAFWGLVIIWETGYLPLTRTLNPRFIGTLFRRFREIGLQARGLLGHGPALGRLAKGFAQPKDSGGAP